jgi:hypothetical protein
VHALRNEVSTINGVFFSISPAFLPEGVIVGVLNFAWGFNSQKKISFGVKTNLGDPLPPGDTIFRKKTKKC